MRFAGLDPSDCDRQGARWRSDAVPTRHAHAPAQTRLLLCACVIAAPIGKEDTKYFISVPLQFLCVRVNSGDSPTKQTDGAMTAIAALLGSLGVA